MNLPYFIKGEKMKTLKRTRYNTMNSWNLSTAPAYNLKIHNVIDNDLQDKVYEMMDIRDFYDGINDLIYDFNVDNDFEYQAGFNGRSGGYLVLYNGGKKTDYYTKKDFDEKNSYDGRVYIGDGWGWKDYEEAKKLNLVDTELITSVYTQPGQGIKEGEAPGKVLRSFRKLAVNIVKHTEYLAKNCSIVNEEYLTTRKVIA